MSGERAMTLRNKDTEGRILEYFAVGAIAGVMPAIYLNKGCRAIDATKLVSIPIVYGVIYAAVRMVYPGEWGIKEGAAFGAVFGLIMSLIGRFIYRIPSKVFNMGGNREWIVHPVAMAMYGLYFGGLAPLIEEKLIHRR